MASTNLGTFCIGSTDRIRVTIKKDAIAWNNIDSATIVFEPPNNGTQFTRSLTLESGNIWYYDTEVDDFTEVGYWKANVRVVDGTIVKRYPAEIGFRVVDQP